MSSGAAPTFFLPGRLQAFAGSRVGRLLARRVGATLGLGLGGSLLLWLAQPPLMLSVLAWVAPAPWLLLVLQEDQLTRRGWLAVWLAGAVYWMAALYWVVLPHPLTPLGLPFLGGYLGLYLPAFVGLSRVGVHRLRLPIGAVAPVVWTGLELLQAHLFSGFLMGALGHTQAWFPRVIQIAELGGAYAVSFLVMLFAAGVVDGVRVVVDRKSPSTLEINPRLPLGFFAAAIPLAAAVFYGHYALQAADARYATQPTTTVALIQGDTRATWDPDPKRGQRIMERQIALTKQAAEQANVEGRAVDLMVWPESMFMTPVATFDGVIKSIGDREQPALGDMRVLASVARAPVLIGLSRFDFRPPYSPELLVAESDGYNSTLLVDSNGEPRGLYSKVHRVPFGEYIPLFEDWEAMAYLTPMPGGTKAGDGPVAIKIPVNAGGEITLSPNICYETVIPHVIRRQLHELADDESLPADLMVNVTNNAWFWGASELEMHLACNIFRAVENRTPMVVAANGGLSAAIDSAGRVLAVSERQREEVLLADVPLDPRQTSFYTDRGDLLALPCLIVCGLLAIIGVAKADGGRRKADE